jgi:hypothetical protein
MIRFPDLGAVLRHRPTAVLLLAALVLAPAACASGAAAGADRAPRTQSNRLTADEIQSGNYQTAYEAVRALRPAWLHQRGNVSLLDPGANEVAVYLDGAPLGGPGELRQVRAGDVVTMEYLSGTEATTRFGTGNAGGAIVISTTRR